jgi:hypothetical protein
VQTKLDGKPERKKQPGKPMHRWKANITTDLKKTQELGCVLK